MALILYNIIDMDAETEDDLTEEMITLSEVRDFLYDFWWDDEEAFDSKKEKREFLHEIKFTEDENRLASMLEGIGYDLMSIEESEENRVYFDNARQRLLNQEQ